MVSIFSVHWIILFTLWATSIVALLTFIHFGREIVQFRKWIGFNLILVFFFSGAFSYQYSLPSSQRKHFSHSYLQGDRLLAKVLDVEQDTVGFRKCLVDVEVVRKNRGYHNSVGNLLCYVKASKHILKGDILEINPRINRITNSNNPGEFDAESYWKTRSVEHVCFLRSGDVEVVQSAGYSDRFWLDVRNSFKRILDRFLSPENKQVAQALVLGDKSELSSEQRSEYANAGAMHVLAVSGMHVGILLAFLQWFFYRIKWFRKRGYFIIVALIVLWSFAFLTGLSSSVLRATLMFSVLSIGQLRGYSFFSLNALFVAALVILFIDPRSLFSIGFQLSFLAMLGIAYFYGPLRSLFHSQYRVINYLWDGTALGLAAQIGTIPISLYYFHQFPNYFLITNLGLIILAGIAMISVVVLLMLFWVPGLGAGLGYIVDLIFTILNSFIGWINNLPATISKGFDPSLFWVFLVYLFVSAVIYFWNRKRLTSFKLSMLFLFVCGIFLLYGKISNYFHQEIVFINNDSKLVLIKEPGVVLCVYEKEELEKSDVEYMVDSYAKIMGVEVVYNPLEVGESIEIAKNIEVQVEKSKWEVSYYRKTFSYSDNILHNQSLNNFFPDTGINTRNGAVRIEPNDTQF